MSNIACYDDKKAENEMLSYNKKKRNAKHIKADYFV